MKKILYSKQADKYLSKIAKNDEQAIKNAKRKLILEIIKNFLSNDEILEDDLYLIEKAELEYENNEMIEHEKRNWQL